ncbi:M15 family metallopeptidase [Duganella sp. Root1480D1]|uniref:M15 family metallopeptidase n=1 Tax=Duganella sp. Root1480D1 TaxID=1736471 RepID=UPI00070E57A5|nr:M15 family metallopeptidase [Duganella sp. Root1480D1]KQZ27025.1 hypothetical protein ASD58_15725 [Duganella sp. Root1480D1]
MSAEIPNYTVLANFAAAPLLLQVRRPLNIRDAATTKGRRVDGVRPPAQLRALTLVDGEAVNDNSHWYCNADNPNQFFWSGGVEPVLPDLPALGPLPVKRRSNGTILPLLGQDLRTVFGMFDAKELANGYISIDPAWVKQNIASFQHPVLQGIGVKSVELHQHAIPYFEAVFNEIAADPALQNCIRTCAGTFVPRHVGFNPSKDYSSHSWGIAIDLNSQWNSYHKPPAPQGAIGSVRELVPVFAKHGFAWGGHFSGTSIDGMHFELALTALAEGCSGDGYRCQR